MIVIFLQVWTQSPRDLTPPPRAMFLTTATDITFMVPMVTTTERGPLMLRLMLRLSPRLSMATTVTPTVSLDPPKTETPLYNCEPLGLGYNLGYAGYGYAGYPFAHYGGIAATNAALGHAVAYTAGGVTHSSNVGVCTNYLGAVVPC